MTRVVMRTETQGGYIVGITEIKTGRRIQFKVSYGLHYRVCNTLMQAVAEHESCVIHALTSSGAFYN